MVVLLLNPEIPEKVILLKKSLWNAIKLHMGIPQSPNSTMSKFRSWKIPLLSGWPSSYPFKGTPFCSKLTLEAPLDRPDTSHH